MLCMNDFYQNTVKGTAYKSCDIDPFLESLYFHQIINQHALWNEKSIQSHVHGIVLPF